MAQVNIRVCERQLRCSICLDVLREPVSLPCGHSHCMCCLSHYWDQAQSGFCCPQCREEFSPRPALRRNTVLAEVVDRLRVSEAVSEPESFLGGVGEVQLQEKRRTVQDQIRDTERDLEHFQQDLQALKASAAAALEESDAVFADLTQRLDKSKAEVRLRLEAKERLVLSEAEKDLELMKKDLEELRRRDDDIAQLLQTGDDAHLLQSAALLPVSTRGRARVPALPTHVFGDARRGLCRLRSRVDELCQDELDHVNRTLNENLSSGVKGGRSAVTCKPPQTVNASLESRVWCGLTLDADTAHSTLVLLEGLQGAHCGEEPQPYPPHPHRFDSVAQVLCREGQSGGAAYWEVEWRGGGWVDIGVTYRGIGRKGGGKPCLLGRNENSWRLRCTHAGYTAWHENRKITVAAPPCPRIGVFLERHKGALSFYSVSDAVLLLHTFRCTFTQPLYPAFRLDLDSTLMICSPETPES